ncbi:MAG: hypothetical protein CEE43_03430 [Promethearchaeota archaeon Loki_b32]|nr:MAG: hypothetical protein CEE43_03430 [Candidatus Lokiarchaeota archaeon Loki_b32]
MLPSDRISKKYPTLLKLLKFAIRNDDNPEFQDFSLVDSYIQVLIEIETNLDEVFNEKVRGKTSLGLDEILFSFFKDEVPEDEYKTWVEERQAINNKVQDFKEFINSEEKKDLIRKFKLINELTDMADDRCLDDKEYVDMGYGNEEEGGGLWYLEEVDKEMNTILTCFRPILKNV